MDNELCSTQATDLEKTAVHLSHVDLMGTLLCDFDHICVTPNCLQLSYNKSAPLNFFLGKRRCMNSLSLKWSWLIQRVMSTVKISSLLGFSVEEVPWELCRLGRCSGEALSEAMVTSEAGLLTGSE